MKRLLSVAAFVLFAVCANAAELRDVLLTPAGRLYTAETATAADDAGHHVMLSVLENGETREVVVPDSLSQGFRSAPALAYDAESDTLFVFFLRMPNIASSELILVSYRDGKWTSPISVDNKSFRLRSNLRIAVTRRLASPQDDGTSIDIARLQIHAVWWEQTGNGEEARYALVALEKGVVSDIELHELGEFVTSDPSAADVDLAFNPEILRHPAILENGTTNSVDVLFGDVRMNRFHRATIRPIFALGRIHIPIGRAPGHGVPGPRAYATLGGGNRIDVIATNGKLLLYSTDADADGPASALSRSARSSPPTQRSTPSVAWSRRTSSSRAKRRTGNPACPPPNEPRG
jgi:hypothetical protein